MRYHVLISSVAALAVAGELAEAQLAPPTVKVVSTALPIATTSFTPYAGSGMLGSAAIELSLTAIDLLPTARLNGSVMLSVSEKSVGYLSAPVLLPVGTYSVLL